MLICGRFSFEILLLSLLNVHDYSEWLFCLVLLEIKLSSFSHPTKALVVIGFTK